MFNEIIGLVIIDENEVEDTTPFWIDRNFVGYDASEIDDDYLKHIIYFVSEGKGWDFFLTKDRINAIFEEAYARKICRPDVIFALHRMSLYNFGYTTHMPRLTVDWNGNYIRN